MSHRTFNDPHGTSLEARQGLLDNRSEHKPKRHRTIGRRKWLSAAKRAKVKHNNAVRLAEYRELKKRVRAYWTGKSEVHP